MAQSRTEVVDRDAENDENNVHLLLRLFKRYSLTTQHSPVQPNRPGIAPIENNHEIKAY